MRARWRPRWSSTIPRILAIADRRRHGPSPAEFPEFDASFAFDELGLPDARAMAFRYDVAELSSAIKPTAILRLMEQGYERVVYIDPDIQVFRQVHEALAALDAGATTVLTPHALAPNLNAEGPNDLSFLLSGVFNLGFMALRNTPDTVAMLEWAPLAVPPACAAGPTASAVSAIERSCASAPG